jgi:hypothetical protein
LLSAFAFEDADGAAFILFESSIAPTSFGSAEQRLQRGGSLISGPIIVFAPKEFAPP